MASEVVFSFLRRVRRLRAAAARRGASSTCQAMVARVLMETIRGFKRHKRGGGGKDESDDDSKRCLRTDAHVPSPEQTLSCIAQRLQNGVGIQCGSREANMLGNRYVCAWPFPRRQVTAKQGRACGDFAGCAGWSVLLYRFLATRHCCCRAYSFPDEDGTLNKHVAVGRNDASAPPFPTCTRQTISAHACTFLEHNQSLAAVLRVRRETKRSLRRDKSEQNVVRVRAAVARSSPGEARTR